MRAMLRTLLGVGLGLSAQVAGAQTQPLTPGAAAIGGLTTTLPLIAPNGARIPVLTDAGTTDAPLTDPASAPLQPLEDVEIPQPTPEPAVAEPPTREPEFTSDGTKIHRPDPDWPLTFPAARGNRGGSATTASRPADPEPTPSPAPARQEPQPANSTAQVTAGATPATAPAAPAAPDPVETFEPVRLNFGPDGEDVSPQHQSALDPVESLMRANPLLPLRVVAILAVAEADDEAAKQQARRRILAVRGDLIRRGLNADNLTFVISANASTDAYADFVLIER